MDTRSLTLMPGYRYNEYLLVLSPHEALGQKIMQVRKDFHDSFKTASLHGVRPHVALLNFVQIEMMEQKIVSRLGKIAMGYRPFKVELKNFESYPTHTIFINIESKQQLKNLTVELKTAQELLKLNSQVKPHFFQNPSITLATKLLPWQYEKSWKEYKLKSFTGTFIAEQVLLIRRRLGEKGFHVLRGFGFMNSPVSTRQGELFK